MNAPFNQEVSGKPHTVIQSNKFLDPSTSRAISAKLGLKEEEKSQKINTFYK